MSKELKTKHYIGTVKKDCSKDIKVFAGLELFVMHVKNDEEALIIGASDVDQLEKFFKASYENGMKEMISDDYEYFVWYLANNDCEFVPYIKLSDLENLREATQKDADKFDKSFKEFKKIHKFAEREQAMKEQEEREKIAIEEFKKLDKVDFEVRVEQKSNRVVKAIMYKGFAVHNSIEGIDAENSPYKTITVTEGEGKGMKLLDCNVTEYKKCIDEIKAVIGDKILEMSDLAAIKPIVGKY